MMGDLSALDVKKVPVDCLIRHGPRAVYAEDKETVLRTEIDTPPAKYCWLVDGVYVSGDHALPCILGEETEEDSPVVAQMTQLCPRLGTIFYGPSDIRKNQMDAWVANGIPGLEK